MDEFVRELGYAQMLLCLVALIAITWKRQWREYWSLGAFLGVRLGTNAMLISLQRRAPTTHNHAALYHSYFWTYWAAFAIEAGLALVVVYTMFGMALRPLRGLRRLTWMLFAVAGGVSLMVAFWTALVPAMSGTQLMVASVSQMQRTQSVLTLCLLLFVCIAIRPMGLSYRSRIFGVGLGLGVMAINDLLQSAGMATYPQAAREFGVVNGLVACAAVLVWAVYFTMPEPKRGEIAVTLLRWNSRLTGRA